MPYRKRVVWASLDIESAVKNNYSASSALRFLGMETNGGNCVRLREAIKDRNIDTSHWWGRSRYKCGSDRSVPLESVLVENGTYHRTLLKRRLLESGTLEEKCTRCGQGNSWNGKPLVLQLDHVNGVFNDNRLSNLRILCPNCHTQTPTFVGRNTDSPNKCLDCGLEIDHRASRCMRCAAKHRRGKG